MSEVNVHGINLTNMDEVEQDGIDMKGINIWQDVTCLALLREGVLPELIGQEERKRVRRRAASYCWKEQKLFFKDLS
jgi:hypothetical protein